MRPRQIRARQMIALVVGLLVAAGNPPIAAVAETGAPEESAAVGRTPPRLSFADGQVSFWRPGAQEWTQAQVNTPLAPGDQLYTGSPGNLELQIGARAFVRGWGNTQLGLENQEPEFVQFKVTAGHVSFDLRTLEPGRTVEVDTPNAAFTIEHVGYYRVDVAGERTSFITRRGGRATVTPANGPAGAITASEEVVIEGTSSPQVASYVAPLLDDWDGWNYARTERLLDAVSPRYVSPGTYGVSDLDQYGAWRVVSDYGPVWVPVAVPAGWVPYSTGSWMLDPYYGWTWVDTAPWGWAPYHHGRWVFVDGFWAWAPGPVLVRPVYAPALVAFFGGPVVGWVALGWGEPLVPWWGPAGFIHSPWWGGWGGPRVVNNVIINRATVVNVRNITVYRNTNVQNAVVAVNENHFGRGPIASSRVTQVDVKGLHPVHTAPNVAVTPASFVPTASRGIRPPEDQLRRSVVATRPPHTWSESAPGGERKGAAAGIATPPPRLVPAPQQRETALAPSRPPFGQSKVERSTVERTQPPAPPRFEGPRRPERTSESAPPAPRQTPPQPRRELQVAAPPPAAPQPPARRPEAQRPPTPSLPGQPANGLAPNRAEARPSQPPPPHDTMRPPQRGERQAPSPPVHPSPGPENAPRERSGGQRAG